MSHGFTLVPPYSLLGALYYIFRINLLASLSVSGESITTSDYFQMDNTLMPTLILIWGQTILYIFLIYFIDVGHKKLFARRATNLPSLDDNSSNVAINIDGESHTTDGEDVDVTQERVRALSDSTRSVFKLQRLRKVFTEGGLPCTKPSRVKVCRA